MSKHQPVPKEEEKNQSRKMYMTRNLSQLQKSPDLLSVIPEGPNSGYLVIQDEESETYSWFGYKNHALKNLPFPQNKELSIHFGDYMDRIFMIPVLNQPLSSNLYYTIDAHGKHKGEAFTCSKEEDKVDCCCCRCVEDVKPRPLDLHDMYQQLEIVVRRRGGYFFANSIAPDGFPPDLIRTKGWSIFARTPRGHFKLDQEAQGVDSSLRARLPEFNVSPSMNSSEPVVVGRWYCPFMFVKEGTLRDQVKRSMYYEVTLEQRWDQIFSFQKNNVSDYHENSVVIDVLVEKEEVSINGNEATWSVRNGVDGVIWFTGYGSGGGQVSVGLREEVVQRMKWEQDRFGFVGGEERQVKINRVEEFTESSWGWNEMRCFVLVERFNLKRMDGSLVMAYDFKHCHQMKIKWE